MLNHVQSCHTRSQPSVAAMLHAKCRSKRPPMAIVTCDSTKKYGYDAGSRLRSNDMSPIRHDPCRRRMQYTTLEKGELGTGAPHHVGKCLEMQNANITCHIYRLIVIASFKNPAYSMVTLRRLLSSGPVIEYIRSCEAKLWDTLPFSTDQYLGIAGGTRQDAKRIV